MLHRYFLSIPVDVALSVLGKHLETLELDQNKKVLFLETAKLCMDQSFFQFREKTYKIEFGTSMGNPLSPLIAELFMANFEITLKKHNLLPRVWLRYVDDVFAIIPKGDSQKVLEILNSQYQSIKFTCEHENNGSLPFLDLNLRRIDDKIDVGVYHKPTSTMRTITSDSFCPIQHKQAAYHSPIHRLCRLPLSVANFKKEYDYICETARVNGYRQDMVDKLVYKHSNKVKKSNLTTFFSQKDTVKNQRVSFAFVPQITNKLKSKFADHNLDIVYRSDRKLSNLLGSTKDKTPKLNKSGIYTVTCGECKRVYYGQTKRSVEERYKEHVQCIRLNHPNKSAVASHVIIDGHTNISRENVNLLKQVNDCRRLDAYEAFYIQNDENALNQDNGNIE